MTAILANPVKATIGAFLLTGIMLLLEYFNGGVASHHLLASEDLPEFSNWWGLLAIPLLAWLCSFFIKRRINKDTSSSENQNAKTSQPQVGFFSALAFGIVLSVLWELRLEHILQYVILLPFLVAFFKPIHFPAFLLGFVIGMMYTFGGILPIIIGTVLLSICFIINTLTKLVMKLVSPKSIKPN